MNAVREHPPVELRNRAWRAVAMATLGIAMLGACASDGQPAVPGDGSALEDVALPDGGGEGAGGGDGGESAQGPEGEPAPEPAPEEPAPEEPAADEGGDASSTPADDEGWTTEEWVLLIVLGVAVVAVIIGATSAATSHSEKKRHQQAQQSNLHRQLSSVVGSTRWVLDHGSMNVLRADPQDAQNIWNSVRPQVVSLEAAIAQHSGGTGDVQLDGSIARLGQDVAGLRGALDSYVSTAATGQRALIDRAQQTVLDRCQQVETSLQTVMAMQP